MEGEGGQRGRGGVVTLKSSELTKARLQHVDVVVVVEAFERMAEINNIEDVWTH